MGEQPVVPLAPRQPFWGLVVSGRRGGGGWIEWQDGRERKGKREEMEEDKGGKNVSWYHSLTCATASPPPLHPRKKGRNKSISRRRGICVIY